jgi:hypothetical protein
MKIKTHPYEPNLYTVEINLGPNLIFHHSYSDYNIAILAIKGVQQQAPQAGLRLYHRGTLISSYSPAKPFKSPRVHTSPLPGSDGVRRFLLRGTRNQPNGSWATILAEANAAEDAKIAELRSQRLSHTFTTEELF